MLRHRTVAGSPVRSATEVWAAIEELAVDSLALSQHLDADKVRASLQPARHAVLMLVAGGHLEHEPLSLIAPPKLDVRIGLVTGVEALDLDENLGPVPGATAARDWTLHLPTAEPLTTWLADAVTGQPHLSVDPPTSSKANNTDPGPSSVIDLTALERREVESQ